MSKNAVLPTNPDESEDPSKRLLNRVDAAQWLGVSKQYLAVLAQHNKGPQYKVIGKRAMYLYSDLLAWWEAQPYARNDPEAKRAAKPDVVPAAPEQFAELAVLIMGMWLTLQSKQK